MTKHKWACLLLISSLLLSGCDGREVDPGYNLAGLMKVFPDQSAQEDLSTSVLPGESTEDNVDSSIGDSNAGIEVINPEQYPELGYSIISATSYSQYLESVVNQPVQKVFAETGYKNLYYSICLYGYEPTASNTMTSSPAAYTDIKVGSNVGQTSQYLRGVMVPKFAKTYLASVGKNSATMSRAYKNWRLLLSECGVSDSAKWASAKVDGTFCTKFPTVLNMWGNTRLYNNASIAGSFSDFKTVAGKGEVIGVVPDIQLQLLTGYQSYSSVTLNPTAGLGTSAYYDRISYSDAQKLFTSYNQQQDRDKDYYTVNGSDAYSIVHAEIDGYTRCIVALCCLPGTTLERELGKTNLEKIKKSITGFASWKDTSAVRDIVADAVIITKGTRGVS